MKHKTFLLFCFILCSQEDIKGLEPPCLDDGRCLEFVIEDATWSAANRTCARTNGSRLASPADPSTQQWLEQQLGHVAGRTKAAVEFWTGGHRVAGDWTDEEGKVFVGNLSKYFLPNPKPIGYCVLAGLTGANVTLRQVQCSARAANPLCQKHKDDCPAASGICFAKVSQTGERKMMAASRACAQEKMHLPSALTGAELKRVLRLSQLQLTSNADTFWIGLSSAIWRWADGSRIESVGWHESSPDSAGNGLSIKRFAINDENEKKWKWTNQAMNTSLPFICESGKFPAPTNPVEVEKSSPAERGTTVTSRQVAAENSTKGLGAGLAAVACVVVVVGIAFLVLVYLKKKKREEQLDRWLEQERHLGHDIATENVYAYPDEVEAAGSVVYAHVVKAPKGILKKTVSFSERGAADDAEAEDDTKTNFGAESDSGDLIFTVQRSELEKVASRQEPPEVPPKPDDANFQATLSMRVSGSQK